MCAIFEKSVKTLLDDFAPMVPQLCEMLGRMYSTIPQASALDLTRQVGLLGWAVGALEVTLVRDLTLGVGRGGGAVRWLPWLGSPPVSQGPQLTSVPCSVIAGPHLCS